jgi:hypothetical protein
MYQQAAIIRKKAQALRLDRLVTMALLAVVAVSVPGCDEQDPTGTDLTTSTEGAQAGFAASVVAADASATPTAAATSAALPLPISQSVASSVEAFSIRQTGSGGAGDFRIENASSGEIALAGRTNGIGTAVYGTTSNGTAVKGMVYGGGKAGHFEIANPGSPQTALLGKSNGGGPAVQGIATGSGVGGWFDGGLNSAINARNIGSGRAGEFSIIPTSNSKAALYAQTYGTGMAVNGVAQGQGNAGVFENKSATNTKPALYVNTQGAGWAGVFTAPNPGSKGVDIHSNSSIVTLAAENSGTGFAAKFFGYGSAKGVYIQTQGGAGLQVVGGSKNAVVHTPSGAKALYTEESTEVWFTDYGFGRLANGRTRVLLDPSFAQTINPDEPYHVFLQARGRAELYVGETTPLGFEVVLKDGDPSAEFSYRIVAKRLGFEGKRLEAAPWADRLGGLEGQIR